VDWKVECGQHNLTHVTKNKKNYKKEDTKTNARAQYVQSKSNIRYIHTFCSALETLWMRYTNVNVY